MSTVKAHTRPWWPHAAGFAVVAVLVHLLAVWATPGVIMRIVGNKVTAIASGAAVPGVAEAHDGVLHAPQVTAQSRSVVMPSPDMLYSVCTFDVSQRPLHISAHPALGSYWSIALYASNTDNFYVLNDRQAGSKPVDLTLVSRHSADAGKPGVVVPPTDTGVLLMRVLTGNYEAEKAVLEPARRTLQCTPAKAPA